VNCPDLLALQERFREGVAHTPRITSASAGGSSSSNSSACAASIAATPRSLRPATRVRRRAASIVLLNTPACFASRSSTSSIFSISVRVSISSPVLCFACLTTIAPKLRDPHYQPACAGQKVGSASRVTLRLPTIAPLCRKPVLCDASRPNSHEARLTSKESDRGPGTMSSATTEMGSSALDLLEQETIARVKWRLIPLLFICYYAAYLDRVNVGFAALHMNKALGLTAAAFGLGGGIFFVGYFLAEIPSNLILERIGARVWIARILLTWGVISALTAFVWNDWSFYVIRFLLGIAEAGYYPGIILYLTWWFPSAYRSRMIALFMTAIPVAVITGSWASGFILGMDGIWGLAGWEWLFIIEAMPAIILGVVVYFYLTDRPEQTHWLTEPQRTWLSGRLAAERAQRERIRHFALGETLRNPRVWALTLVYFGQNVTGYGFVLFLPQIVKEPLNKDWLGCT
jgi:Major Facilitator Superfamily